MKASGALPVWWFLQNNMRRVTCLVLLFIALSGAFVWRFLMYAIGRPYAILWHQKLELYGYTLCVAKGCGQANKVIFALILLPVSRNTMTWLRETPLRIVVPFDDCITFHRLLGTLGLLSSLVHTACHMVDFAHETGPGRAALWQQANPTMPQPSLAQQFRTQVAVTGLIMLLCMFLAYPFAMKGARQLACIRGTRFGRFLGNHNWFYATHHLFVFFYVALLLHPRPAIPNEAHEWLVSDTWVWVAVPVLIYMSERMLRGLRRRLWKTQVLGLRVLSGSVVALRLSKSTHFSFRPGQYIFLRCPDIALFEWHPYSITSAPADPYLTVHIKAAGDWSRLVFEAMQAAATEQRQAQGCVATHPQSSAMLAAGPAERQENVASQANEDGLATPEQQQPACVEMATARTKVIGWGPYPQIAPGSALLDSSDALLPPPEALHFGTGPHQADGSTHAGVSCEAAGRATQAEESCQTTTQVRTLRVPLGSTEGAPVATHPFAPQVIVDGPYGSPTQYHEDFNTVLLVGAGIGVTPFASVLRHLLHCFQEDAPGSVRQGAAANAVQRRIFFVWTVREMAASEWFIELLRDLKLLDIGDILSVSVHVTGHMPQQEPPDAESGVKDVAISPGRPDWDDLFSTIAANRKQNVSNKQRVGVFYCGPPVLGKVLRQQAWHHSSAGGTRFVFHQERF